MDKQRARRANPVTNSISPEVQAQFNTMRQQHQQQAPAAAIHEEDE
jgi:hypothetical protein